jgi:hypothetical protein
MPKMAIATAAAAANGKSASALRGIADSRRAIPDVDIHVTLSMVQLSTQEQYDRIGRRHCDASSRVYGLRVVIFKFPGIRSHRIAEGLLPSPSNQLNL